MQTQYGVVERGDLNEKIASEGLAETLYTLIHRLIKGERETA